MRYKNIFAICAILLSSTVCLAENIDPDNSGRQYAYGENIGWVNFEASGAGATVSGEELLGYIWAENIGWINLSPTSYGGVFNDGSGNLSGYAWGENVGWINFDPTYGGVSIDQNGNFSGWAWGENIGWINFDNADLFSGGVKVCMVNYFDLKSFAEQWLLTGTGHTADLYPDNNVNFKDFAVLADYWFDYCPDNWNL